MCDTTQSKEELQRVYSSRPVWTAAPVTFVIMGVSKAWTQPIWQRLKDPESRKWAWSRVKTRPLHRRAARREGDWSFTEGVVRQTATRLISAKISPCGELKGSEACCWLGNGTGALTHELSGAKLLRSWCYTGASQTTPGKKSLAQTRLTAGWYLKQISYLQNCVPKTIFILYHNSLPSIIQPSIL